jgi:hypothetical protein
MGVIFFMKIQYLEKSINEFRENHKEILKRLLIIEARLISLENAAEIKEVLQDSCDQAEDTLIAPIITPRYMVENWAAIRM